MTDSKEKELEGLGGKLRQVREILGITQKELAGHVGVTHASIARMEGGKSFSARILNNVLAYYSQFVSVDVLFDDKAWEIAMQDREMLFKKTHINSIIHAKLTLMKKHLIDEMRRMRAEQADMDREFEGYIRRGMDGAINMLDEE